MIGVMRNVCLKLFFLALQLIPLNLWAEGELQVVRIDVPGTLSQAISNLEVSTITDLQISGCLNADDIKYLREATGKLETLENLNLAEVTLQPGKDPYYVSDMGLSTGAGGMSTKNSRYFYIAEENSYKAESNTNGYGGYSIKEYFYSNCLAGAFEGMKLKSVVWPYTMKSIGAYAFYSCANLETVNIPVGTTRVEDAAFMNCTMLTLPAFDSLNYAGRYAFHGTSWYTSQPDGVVYQGKVLYTYKGSMPSGTTLTVNDGTTCIASSAFQGCYNLAAVSFPVSLKQICNRAFYGCNNIASGITLSALESLGEEAFYGCSSLPSATISAKTIGNSCFESCYKLSELSLSGVESIGERAFYGCNALASELNLESASNIGAYAFYECSLLPSVTLSSKLTRLRPYVFYKCSGMTTITLPESIRRIDKYSLSAVKELVVPESVDTLTHSSLGSLSKLVLPKLDYVILPDTSYGYGGGMSINNKPIPFNDVEVLVLKGTCRVIPQSFKSKFFSSSTNLSLKELVMEEGIEQIGAYSFYQCRSLETIHIPSTVKSIGEEAFEYCSALSTAYSAITSPFNINSKVFSYIASGAILYVPAGTKAAYSSKTGWTHFNIVEVQEPAPDPDDSGVCGVGVTYAFYESTKTLTISKTGEGTGAMSDFEWEGAPWYSYRSKIETIVIEDGVTTIGSNAFCNCPVLSALSIANSVVDIRLQAFYDCVQLKQLELPNSALTISTYAFKQCAGLTSLRIPANVSMIEWGAFQYCRNLSSITVDEGNQKYDSRNNCNAVIEKSTSSLILGCKNTVIPDDVVCIGKMGFVSPVEVSTFAIPDGVNEISEWAFQGSDISSIVIPGSVKVIGERAFASCNQLESVKILSKSLTEYGANAFLNNASGRKIYVPEESVETYKAGWPAYADDIEPIKTVLDPIEDVDFGTDIDEHTDLNGNVIGDVLYSISSEHGSYDPQGGCIVLTVPTDDSAINGQNIFGEEFQNSFTGIVFNVPAGSGSVKLTAETIGNMVLKVKIGSNAAIEMELQGKLTASFPYTVSEPTNVYVYAGIKSAMARGLGLTTSTDSQLKIYGVKVDPSPTGIHAVYNDRNQQEIYYSLEGRKLSGRPTSKGIYITNGHKVIVK